MLWTSLLSVVVVVVVLGSVAAVAVEVWRLPPV